MEERKSTAVLLWVAAVLALLTGAVEASLYFYARSHLAEILREGSVRVFNGLFTVTEDAALANPHLTAVFFCLVVSAACFFGLHALKRRTKKR